jgi:MFS family permease
VLVVLCVTETTSWGIVFYAYPVLAAAITADTGWSRTSTAAAFSFALVISALVGIPVGRRLDADRPRVVMTLGSVAAVAAVVAPLASPHPGLVRRRLGAGRRGHGRHPLRTGLRGADPLVGIPAGDRAGHPHPDGRPGQHPLTAVLDQHLGWQTPPPSAPAPCSC